MAENGNKLTWIIMAAMFGILSTGGSFWANAMYAKVSSIDSNLQDKSERVVRLETQYGEINKKLDKIDYKIERIISGRE